MSKSTRKARPRKSTLPARPYPEFPLGPHPNGRWQKRINGKLRYFGRWGRVVNGEVVQFEGDDWWKPALEIYKAQIDDIRAGRPIGQAKPTGLTIKELCNRFLTAKYHLLESGEIAKRTFDEYRATTDRLIEHFGKERPVDDLTDEDFDSLRAEIARQWGPVRLANEIVRVRSVFRKGRKLDLVPDEFRKPSKRVMRRHRKVGGKRVFSAEEIRAMLDNASVPLRGMILLGINAAFGGYDCGTLPLDALDLEGGWVSYARSKTGIERRAKLWPETREALKVAIAERPEPRDPAHADLVFLTKYRQPWASEGRSDAVTQEMGKLLRRLGINGRRNLGHYSLRHTFRTVADKTKDFPAIRWVMGHADPSAVDEAYLESIDDSRLEAVAAHVWGWLRPSAPESEVQ